MSAGTLVFFLFIVVCPLAMFFMMRGMSGGGHGGMDHGQDSAGPHVIDTTDQDGRIAQLEHEVATLRAAQPERDAELVGPSR